MNAEPNEEGYFLSQIPKPKPPRQTKKTQFHYPSCAESLRDHQSIGGFELENAWGETRRPPCSCRKLGLAMSKGGSCWFLIKNNLVLQELTMRKKEILARLQNFPAFSEIRDLRLRLEMF